MKTKLSLITLFACAAAGTPLFADNENYDGQGIEEELGYTADFSGQSLIRSSWREARLVTCDFSGANLTEANFSGAIVFGTWFSSNDTYGTTVLRDAVFDNSRVAVVDFFGVDATGVSFRNAEFTGLTRFSSSETAGTTILRNADFSGCTIAIADVFFIGADLSGASFSNARIFSSDRGNCFVFSGANLTEADFNGAYLGDCLFDNDSTYGATILRNANFSQAELRNADFSGADLTDVVFTNAVLNNVTFDAEKIVRTDFRGAEVEVNLLKKVQLTIAVNDEFVESTIQGIMAGAATGHIGDGKIFVLPLERAIRIRTKEENSGAIG